MRGGLLRKVLSGSRPSFVRQRGKILRNFADSMGFVYFGNVNQHEDDVDVIRGFTTSLTHHDRHYAVGTYNGYNIRFVDRSDTVAVSGTSSASSASGGAVGARRHGKKHSKKRTQTWLILEIELETHGIPHMAFVPTGSAAGDYARIYSVNPTMAPLNGILTMNHSPEFYGRYQILAATTHAKRIDAMFPSPVMVAMGVKLWPHGLEIARHKLNIYLPEARLTKTLLESTLAAGLWLAETIDTRPIA